MRRYLSPGRVTDCIQGKEGGQEKRSLRDDSQVSDLCNWMDGDRLFPKMETPNENRGFWNSLGHVEHEEHLQ